MDHTKRAKELADIAYEQRNDLRAVAEADGYADAMLRCLPIIERLRDTRHDHGCGNMRNEPPYKCDCTLGTARQQADELLGTNPMSNERTYAREDLVAFGNYLLSEQRRKLYAAHPGRATDQLEERLSEVNHADVDNFNAWLDTEDQGTGEVVAWMTEDGSRVVTKANHDDMTFISRGNYCIPLYRYPPAQARQRTQPSNT